MSIVEQSPWSYSSYRDYGYTEESIKECTFARKRAEWAKKQICSCCGFIMCYSWDEWNTWFQGIQIFIAKEDRELPEETETERFVKLPGVDGDFIYIKEQKAHKENSQNFTPWRGFQKHLPPYECPPSSPYGALYFQSVGVPYDVGHGPKWDIDVFKEIDKDVQLVFMILTQDQLVAHSEGFQLVKDNLGPLVYESPTYVYNHNMGGAPRLKLFIFKKEKE